jgi:hypothetical protein
MAAQRVNRHQSLGTVALGLLDRRVGGQLLPLPADVGLLGVALGAGSGLSLTISDYLRSRPQEHDHSHQ